MEIKNSFNKHENNKSNKNANDSHGYFKRYSSTIKSFISEEIQKPQEERFRDLKALILTIIIVAIIVFIFWKVPFLHNLIFP